MHEPFHAGTGGDRRHSSGGFDVHGLKRISPALDVEADCVDDSPGASDGRGDRALVIDVGANWLDTRSRKLRPTAIGMPRSGPHAKTCCLQMADNAPPEKPRAAKYRHRLRRHCATWPAIRECGRNRLPD